ncbi:MAG TPA: signal recognition particle receptor subunit alpha [Candidatus Bathyarchaeia archaeon]|nr:signal recognition particle receptor subunit alpha [Candidatus Bathyarchaeia archaeon]
MFDTLVRTFSSVATLLSGTKKISPAIIEKVVSSVHDALLDADVSYDVVQAFIAGVRRDIGDLKPVKKLTPDDQICAFFYEKIVAFLGGEQAPFFFQLPSVTMVMGLQGSGKTTTAAKLAYRIMKEAQEQKKDRRVLLASIDFYRPAAIDQLEVMAKNAGCSFYRARSTKPIQAAQEIYEFYKNNRFDLLLLDTAGRLHVDDTMLEELCTVKELLRPQYKLLVLDAMTGQESVAVAKAFDHAVGFDYGILTKMDSDTRGGAAFAFRYALQKSIIFAGFGEKVTDLQPFYADRIAQRMLGQGDLKTLSERMEQVLGKETAEFTDESFTLVEFAHQVRSMVKVGGLVHIAQHLPGGGGMRVEEIEAGERHFKKVCAVVDSMTPKERKNYRILNDSRRMRIAKGAGITVADIKQVLKQFEEMKEFAKIVRKMKNPLKQLFR